MKWRGGKVNRGVMAVVLLALAGWIVPAGAAPVTARYVRVDNPTAPGMSLQEVEVYSGGENVALGKGDSVTGTWKVFPGRTPTEGRQLVDGNNDPNKRGPVFSNVDHDVLGAWIEIDLGESVPIDRAVVYGSSYNAYLDKGDRELTLLDDQRRVVWADKWNAFSASDGTFDMDVAGTEGTSPMNGQTVAANDRMNISMEWFLDDIESGRLPADSSTRMARFQERLSPQALSEVADELFSLLDPDVPELAKARELYAQKKPAEALDEYKRYWFAKMARENLKKGYHVLPPSYPGQADDLLNGVRVTIVSDAK